MTVSSKLGVAVAAIALTLLVGSCGSDGSDTTAAGTEGATLPAPQDLPSGTVATIVEVPAGAEMPFEGPLEDCNRDMAAPDVGEITQAEFDCALTQNAAASGLKQPPKPGDPKYGQARDAAMKALIEDVWIQGQAVEDGLAASEAEIAAELRHLKKENFKSASGYEKFLRSSHYTAQDVDERIKIQILSTNLQRRVEAEASPQSGKRAFDEFVTSLRHRWRARTVCAPAFVVEECSNGS